MAASARKPLSERRWFQITFGVSVLALLFTALYLENYNYRLLWIAMPVGLALAWAWIVRYANDGKQPDLAVFLAALLLMPFFAWPLWVVANAANKLGLQGPVQRYAAVTSHDESFIHSGRSTRRYALEVKLEESGKELKFIVHRRAEAYGKRQPVCEWKGLLGFETFTLGSCEPV